MASTPWSRISAFRSSAALLPLLGPLVVLSDPGHVGAAIHGHPAQDLGGGELLGLAPDLPDALIGVARVGDGGLDEPGHALPNGLDDLGRALAEVDVDGIEEHPPDVVLVLVPGTVAHPHRPRVTPARQVVEGGLGEVLASVDAVHDLQVEVGASPGHRLEDEREVLERLPVEPDPVQRAQHERGVTDPGVAIVPVPGAPGGLGQRGGGGRHDGATGGVAQTLERQCAALHVHAPRVVGKRAVGEPVPPVADGGRELLLRLVQVGGLAAGPRQRDKCALALVQGRAPVTPGARRPEAEGRRDGELRVTGRRAARHDLVAVPLVFPRAGLGPVLEHGHGVDHHFDVALDARGEPQEGARGGGIAGGTPVVGTPGSVGHGLHHQQVLHEEPPARGVPGRLEHHGPGDVAPLVRHVRVHGGEPEVAGGAVQDGAEDTGRVRPGKAQPLDRAVRGDQTVVLAVRKEPVISDGREAFGHTHFSVVGHIWMLRIFTVACITLWDDWARQREQAPPGDHQVTRRVTIG